ncbi:MAG: tetraacyldisaccharide 4'-kinase [Cephaloticoccus sp.]|nr:tetraacyldisaccharide 4'-kinase [Cephaloticoccus sp.]MCF7760468.1 tetraacyldisaccharide 4'-kinase [Cephaloticoccus sp.]
MSSWLKKKSNALELYTIDVILGRRADTGAAIYGAFLQVMSYLFSGVAQLRFWLYRNRILHDQPLGCLVVVVGNLTVGGTGKTPVVEKFARALQDRGRKVAILSRGYKSKKPPLWKKWWWGLTHVEEPPPRIVSDGQNVLLDSEQAGDEPYMLARNLPGVVVLVDKNRVKSGAFAIKRFGCDTLVLDDGFQYLPLKGQLNLLLVDKTNPFGNGHLLPRGILREPIKHLRRASYVFLTKSNGERDNELEALIQKHNPGVDTIECAHRPQYLQRFGADERQPLSFLKGRRVLAFCGIATPESFEKFLRDLGARIVARERYLDHYRYGEEDFVELTEMARHEDAECLITTEKDAVRIPVERVWDRPVYYLRLEIEILRGAADFDEAVSRICFPQNGSRPPVND